MVKLDEISKIYDFFMRNQNDTDMYAFSIDEIKKETGLKNLTHEKLIEIKEIVVCHYKKHDTNKWYRYENMEKQFQDALNHLVKKGLIKEEIKDGTKIYFCC